MDFPERFSNLPVATWPRLRALLDVPSKASDVIDMTIGEPRHAYPAFVGKLLEDNLSGFNKYPTNEGNDNLLTSMSGFLRRRYKIDVPNDQIIALNGTREGLYNAAMALCPETKKGKTPVVISPNPFYPVYGVAALSVGSEPIYAPADPQTGHMPAISELPKDVLERTAIAYICSPANPQGAVADVAYWKSLITLAETYDFRIFSDECYSEIYRVTPPVGALAVAREMGADDDRVLIFQSLSKRSNLPGLRCGFAAGGKQSIARLRQLRAFAGAPLPPPLQEVAAKVWSDEAHVEENRELYRRKYRMADDIFSDLQHYEAPQAGFFLWLQVNDGEAAALHLWKETGVRTLPGSYIAREVDGYNPGRNYIRVALVAPTDETQRGLELIRSCLYG